MDGWTQQSRIETPSPLKGEMLELYPRSLLPRVIEPGLAAEAAVRMPSMRISYAFDNPFTR